MKSVRILFQLLLVAIALALLLQACSRSALVNNRSYDSYQDHIAQTPQSAQVNAEQIFGLVFKDFKNGATEANIRQTYAERLYFNDTIKTLTHVDELVEYMVETAAKVEATNVTIDDVVKSDEDYYIRWTMHIQMDVMGRTIDSKSLGMTQLRFNSDGKIIFHQDYWDGAEGLYEHLPYVGRWVKKIKERM